MVINVVEGPQDSGGVLSSTPEEGRGVSWDICLKRHTTIRVKEESDGVADVILRKKRT